jgi:tetratricopeptide (TPR) repeat protein
MGATLLAVGNYAAAREFLIAAVRFSKSCSDRVLGLNILSNLVACHVEFNEVPEAIAASTRMLTEYQDLAFAGPSNGILCNAATAFALGKQWSLADQCLTGAQLIAQQSDLTMSRVLVAQAEATVAMARGNYAVAAAHAEAILQNFTEQLSNEVRSQLYSLLATCYQQLSRLDDLLAMKKKRLGLSETRYAAGLAAAMVILDLKASLKHLTN